MLIPFLRAFHICESLNYLKSSYGKNIPQIIILLPKNCNSCNAQILSHTTKKIKSFLTTISIFGQNFLMRLSFHRPIASSFFAHPKLLFKAATRV